MQIEKINHFNKLLDEIKTDLMFQTIFNIVDIEKKYGDIKLVFKDDGVGVPKDKQERIFDRFYRVDKSRKRNNSSTGLGMAIVKNILEAHKLNYGIESELNKGTSVWIEIKKEPN